MMVDAFPLPIFFLPRDSTHLRAMHTLHRVTPHKHCLWGSISYSTIDRNSFSSTTKQQQRQPCSKKRFIRSATKSLCLGIIGGYRITNRRCDICNKRVFCL